MSKNNSDQNNVSIEEVQSLLSTVNDPELHRDLVSLNMIRDVEIVDDHVAFTIVLTTPACPLKGKIEADTRAALANNPNIKDVTISWDSSVPQDRRISQQIDQKFKNTIAVSSGKGGVGKTTVAVNLAIGLADSGASVGLLDADILGPNVPTMMGIKTMPAPRDRKLIPAENYGVSYFSMAFLTKPDQPLVWRGPMLHSAIRQLLTDVDWGELDYLVIDLPPGTGDAQLSLAQSIPLSGAVIVTQPMQVAIDDALRGLKMFEHLEVPIIGVIENMSGEFFGSGAGEALAIEYDVPYLGSVPLDAQVRIGGDSGKPIIVSNPESPAAEAFRTITQTIAARISVLTLTNRPDLIPLQMVG
ncbi:MAG TPA: P-loop NTPase [candidate division Zixibacteria bacterium]|nr:P-loop NTPase [candidate division Zixibacteria bacterium]